MSKESQNLTRTVRYFTAGDAAAHDAAKGVRARRASRRPHAGRSFSVPKCLRLRLRLLERLVIDQPLVDRPLGSDPLVRLVPRLLGGAAEPDVIYIDEHLGFGLLVPDLSTGVSRVGEDRANRVHDHAMPPRDKRRMKRFSGRPPVLAPQPPAEHFADVKGRPAEELGQDAYGR